MELMRFFSGVKELLAPGSVRRNSIPPFEAGLRPNSRLDAAPRLLAVDEYEPDSIVALPNGDLQFTAAGSVFQYSNGEVTEVANFGARASALDFDGESTVVAVEGRGLVAVDAYGYVSDVSTDPAVQNCVTDISIGDDGTLYVTVGSDRLSPDEWARALMQRDRTGSLVRVDGDRVETLLGGLGWPAGVLVGGSDTQSVLVSSSLDSYVSAFNGVRRKLAPVVSNVPFHPGRLRHGRQGGCWVMAPYVRNRFTEMIMTEPEFLADMMETIEPREWLVPRLRSERPHADALQMGQLRVLGVIKPWAPPRSYGLVAHLATSGRFDYSAHSRADGNAHGITDLAPVGDAKTVVLAGHGCRNLVMLETEDEAEP